MPFMSHFSVPLTILKADPSNQCGFPSLYHTLYLIVFQWRDHITDANCFSRAVFSVSSAFEKPGLSNRFRRPSLYHYVVPFALTKGRPYNRCRFPSIYHALYPSAPPIAGSSNRCIFTSLYHIVHPSFFPMAGYLIDAICLLCTFFCDVCF